MTNKESSFKTLGVSLCDAPNDTPKFGEKLSEELEKVKPIENSKTDDFSNGLPLEESSEREQAIMQLLGDVQNELEKATFNIETDTRNLEKAKDSISFNKLQKEKLKSQLLNMHNNEMMAESPDPSVVMVIANLLAKY